MSAKPPFEKMRSTLAKRELFQDCVEKKIVVTFKADQEDLFQFVPQEVQKNHLLGRYEGGLPDGRAKIIGYFNVEEDRYFFDGEVVIKSGLIAVSTEIDVFRLERRKAFRVNVPEDYSLRIIISSLDGRTSYHEGLVMDVSGGGFRFRFLRFAVNEVVANGTKLVGTIQLPTGKSIPLEGFVRHHVKIEEERFYGVQLDDSVVKSAHRMMALALDLQQKISRASYK